MRWVRWTAVLFAASLAAFIIGTVIEGFWGASANGSGTNWVDQTFGAAMWIGAALTVLFGLVLVASLLVVGIVRLARRLRATSRPNHT
jgi:apolipoprotein N-acyltransferase